MLNMQMTALTEASVSRHKFFPIRGRRSQAGNTESIIFKLWGVGGMGVQVTDPLKT